MRSIFRHIRVHEDMPDHPKVEPLSDAAFRLLVSSWCWSRKHGTDGRMPVGVWNKRGTPKARQELLAADLAHVQGDSSVQLHDYLDWQPSADELEVRREQARAAGQAGGLAKAKRTAKRTARKPLSGSLSGTPSEPLPDLDRDLKTSSSTPPVGATASPLAVVEDTPNASHVIAAYCDGAKSTGRSLPSERLRGKVGKDAKRLNAAGTPWPDLISAAKRMGSAGWDDLDRELQQPQRGKPVGTGVASMPDEDYLAGGVFTDAMKRRQAREAGESA